MHLRAASPSDLEQIVALIDTVYREYGDSVRLDAADADLRDLEGSYPAGDGAFVVLQQRGDNRILGTHATLRIDATRCTLRRLYVAAEFRGQGCGARLMQWALDWAARHQMSRIEFWSDCRFERGHRFFQQFGFRCNGTRRTMVDGWEPYQEFFFFKDL